MLIIYEIGSIVRVGKGFFSSDLEKMTLQLTTPVDDAIPMEVLNEIVELLNAEVKDHIDNL